MVGPPTHLLVGRKGDLDHPSFDIRVLHKHIDRGHDLCDPRLVIRAQKRRAVAGDDIHPDIVFFQIWIFGGRNDLRRVARQDNIPALVVAVDHRFDIGAGDRRRSIHMGEKADCRGFP